jgi:superfamily II DNA/RNA helicase
MTFASLGLSSPLLRAVNEKRYTAPTPIQVAAIPAVLRGDDVRATAQTGSGKTAAFALPILQTLARNPAASPRPTRALILVPTRELAMQIGESFRVYANHLSEPLKIIAVFGGVSVNPQMMALRGGADVVVATPGRLIDLVEQNALRLNAVATLVLDEADKLLDLGFADELRRVLEMVPEPRQTLLFSATFPQAVQTLAETILRDPVRIDIEAAPSSAPAIKQHAIVVDTAQRTQLLRHLIQKHQWTRILVFVATKYTTEHVAEKLRRAGIHAASFHGELSQGARTQALADFKASKIKVLIATDVAARGIDIVQLPAVVNYDLPRSAVDYTHRIGRTGRAGETGIAVSFITADSEAHFRLIEKRNGIDLEREQVEGFEPKETAQPSESALPGTGGIKGKRKSKKDKLREAAANGSTPKTSAWPGRKS